MPSSFAALTVRSKMGSIAGVDEVGRGAVYSPVLVNLLVLSSCHEGLKRFLTPWSCIQRQSAP
jgi:ribonuclease HIII